MLQLEKNILRDFTQKDIRTELKEADSMEVIRMVQD